MTLLNHRFGNDGVFWISYEDLLKKYQHFDRTRIFDKDWSVSQAWLALDIGWSPEYHSTRFQLTVKEKGPVVIVLSQLDDTYFDGLQGCYAFDLQFRLEDAKEGDPDEYIVRSNGAYAMARSVSTDIELEAGIYIVLMKMTATRQINHTPVEALLGKYAEERRNKFIQMGLSYDLAHAKGVYVESKEEKAERKRKEEERKQEQKLRAKERARQRAEKHWRKQKMSHDRQKARRAKRKNKGQLHEDFVAQDRQGSGSVDAQPNAVDGGLHAEETINGAEEHGEEDAQHPNLPIRIKSSSGETIDVDGPPNDAGGPQVPPPTREMTMEAAIVQSLDEVVQAAEDETMANKTALPPCSTDDPGIKEETEGQPQTPIIQVNGEDAVTDVKPLSKSPPLSKTEHTMPAPDSVTNVSETRKPTSESRQDTVESQQHDIFDPWRPDKSGSQQQERSGSRRHSPFGSRRHDTSGSQQQDNFGSTTANGFRTPANMHNNSDETASMDSFPSFDWNSELDMGSLYDSSSSSDLDDDDSEDGSQQGLFSIDPGDPARPVSSHSSSSSDGSIMYKPPVVPSRRYGSHFRNRRRIHDPPPLDQLGPPDNEVVGEEPWNAVCIVGLRVYSKAGGKDGIELKVVWGENEEEERRKRKKARKDKKRKTKRERTKAGEAEEGRDTFEVTGPHHKLDPDDQGKGAISTGLGAEEFSAAIDEILTGKA